PSRLSPRRLGYQRLRFGVVQSRSSDREARPAVQDPGGQAGECPRSDDLRANRIATYECQSKDLTAIRSDPARGLRAKRTLARLPGERSRTGKALLHGEFAIEDHVECEGLRSRLL